MTKRVDKLAELIELQYMAAIENDAEEELNALKQAFKVAEAMTDEEMILYKLKYGGYPSNQIGMNFWSS